MIASAIALNFFLSDCVTQAGFLFLSKACPAEMRGEKERNKSRDRYLTIEAKLSCTQLFVSTPPANDSEEKEIDIRMK
ncbi:MAG: hypothetical protein ACXVMI_10415 [Flavisolibacter sp.]